MTVKISKDLRGKLENLIGMPPEVAEGCLQFFAGRQSMSVNDLKALLEVVKLGKAESTEKAAAKVRAAAEKVEDKRVMLAVQGCSTEEEARQFLSYVTGRNKVISLNPLGGYSTTLRPSKQGNTSGAGRTPNDKPSGYRDLVSGKEILGPWTTFVKEGKEEDRFDDDTLSALFVEDSGNARSKEKTIAALVAAGEVELIEDDNSNEG